MEARNERNTSCGRMSRKISKVGVTTEMVHTVNKHDALKLNQVNFYQARNHPNGVWPIRRSFL